MSGASCPYCRTAFEADDAIVACSGCQTEHHADCLQENGGCTVFGCSQAPAEEPKISVSDQDLVSGAHPQAPPSTHAAFFAEPVAAASTACALGAHADSATTAAAGSTAATARHERISDQPCSGDELPHLCRICATSSRARFIVMSRARAAWSSSCSLYFWGHSAATTSTPAM